MTVTYELTALGRSLLVVFAGLKVWAESHMGARAAGTGLL